MKINNNYRYVNLSVSIIFISICLLFTGCSKPSTADPIGTITTTISNRGTVIVDANSSPSAYIGYTDTTGVYNFFAGNGVITSVGSIADLAALTTKPSTGYTNAAKAVTGNGYVIVFQSGSYCRIYCVNMSGTTATIKYQYPY